MRGLILPLAFKGSNLINVQSSRPAVNSPPKTLVLAVVHPRLRTHTSGQSRLFFLIVCEIWQRFPMDPAASDGYFEISCERVSAAPSMSRVLERQEYFFLLQFLAAMPG